MESTTPATSETFSAMEKGAIRPFTVMSAHGLPFTCLRAPSTQPTESRIGFSMKSIRSL